MKDPIDILNASALQRYRIPLVVVLLLLIAGGVFFAFRGASSRKAAPGAGSQPENAGTLYTCGMHPQVIQNEPGNCPICGMALTPMKSHDHGASADNHAEHAHGPDAAAPAATAYSVRVEPAVIQKMGLRTTVVEKDELTRTIRAVSHIDFNERSETVINARLNGWAEAVYADFEGQQVYRGQPLVGIYSPEFVATQEEYLQLLRQRQIAGPEGARELGDLLHAARQRLRFWNVSEGQIRQLERARKSSRLLTLYSPYAGVVRKKNIVKGARVTEGMDLLRISDLSTVWAFIHISQQDIPFVEEGMQVRMELPQIPGKEFKGEVSFIFPYMDSKARDLKVRASFPNPDLELKPGMYANLYLENTLSGEHLLVPSSSIIRTGERDIAFVYRGEGIFEPRELKLGVTDGRDRVQVLSGLAEEEAVVISGQFLLDSESRIQEAVRKLRAGAAGSMQDSDQATPAGMPGGGHQH